MLSACMKHSELWIDAASCQPGGRLHWDSMRTWLALLASLDYWQLRLSLHSSNYLLCAVPNNSLRFDQACCTMIFRLADACILQEGLLQSSLILSNYSVFWIISDKFSLAKTIWLKCSIQSLFLAAPFVPSKKKKKRKTNWASNFFVGWSPFALAVL